MEGMRLLSLVSSVLSVGACAGCQGSRGTAAVAHAVDRQGTGAAGCQAAPRLEPHGYWALRDAGAHWRLSALQDVGHCLSQLTTFYSLACQGQPSCSKSHFKKEKNSTLFFFFTHTCVL